MAADVVDDTRDEINRRLKELRPAVAEYQRLEAAIAALDAAVPRSAAPTRRERRGRPRTTPAKPRTGSSGGASRGARTGGGRRRAEALALVQANPGITIADIAKQMGIRHNYLYRVLPGLADEGLVIKDGRGWHPQQTA